VKRRKMNTKILVALVIGITLAGLTGVASAAEQIDSIYYEYTQTFGGEEINPVRVASGAAFEVTDEHFDSTTATINRGETETCAIVGNYMNTNPGMEHGGAYHHAITQSGSADLIMRTMEDEDVLPELELALQKAQSIWYSGQFDSYGVEMAQIGIVGENYGAYGVGLGDPACGNCHLEEIATGNGLTTATGRASITEGTFAMASAQSVDVYLANENTVMDITGGVGIGSTFDGNIDFDDGWITTTVGASETSSISSGSGACGYMPYLP
jgi:hypothetical protein